MWYKFNFDNYMSTFKKDNKFWRDVIKVDILRKNPNEINIELKIDECFDNYEKNKSSVDAGDMVFANARMFEYLLEHYYSKPRWDWLKYKQILIKIINFHNEKDYVSMIVAIDELDLYCNWLVKNPCYPIGFWDELYFIENFLKDIDSDYVIHRLKSFLKKYKKGKSFETKFTFNDEDEGLLDS